MNEEIAFRKTLTANNDAKFRKLNTHIYKITRTRDKTGNVRIT